MRLCLATCAAAALFLVAIPSSASAAGVTKCKVTKEDRARFLVDPDIRVANITCDKARQKIAYKDAGGQTTGGKGCDESIVTPGRNCRFKLSGFSCVSKTNQSMVVTTKCSKKAKGKTQKVNVKYQTGLG